MRRGVFCSVVFSLCGLTLMPARCPAGLQFESAVAEAAQAAADFLAEKQAKTIMPQFQGLPTMPSGGGAGFVELLKEYLAPRGVQIGRASYALQMRLEKIPKDNGFAVRLAGAIVDENNTELAPVRGLTEITDGKELAELLGVSSFFGPKSTPEGRQEEFRKEFDDKQYYDGNGHSLLYSDDAGSYGIGMRVGGKPRILNNLDGLAYTNVDFGEAYNLLLVNNSDREVAVEVKVDGVNVFHFSDPNARRPDGTKLKYWVVAPRTQLPVVGWYKNSQRQIGFRITPPDEGAASQAGVPLTDLGLITATFCESWQKQPPRDEPQVERTENVSRMVPKQQTRTRTFTSPNGELRTREETYTVQVQVWEQRVSTGFGAEIVRSAQGVNRSIGVPRATLAFRYERTKPD